MMKAKLGCDIVSVFHGRHEVQDKKAKNGFRVETGPKIYGKAGEEVTLISDHGGVMIVESKKGQRYPVNSENLIIQVEKN